MCWHMCIPSISPAEWGVLLTAFCASQQTWKVQKCARGISEAFSSPIRCAPERQHELKFIITMGMLIMAVDWLGVDERASLILANSWGFHPHRMFIKFISRTSELCSLQKLADDFHVIASFSIFPDGPDHSTFPQNDTHSFDWRASQKVGRTRSRTNSVSFSSRPS